MTKLSQKLTIVALFVVPVVFYYILKSGRPTILKLGIIGERYYDEQLKDTVYHTIPDFVFTDQLGRKITNDSFSKNIYLANFFFTTCRGTCPKMNGMMLTLYEDWEQKPMVKFLSHTVDPEIDSVPVLLKYANDIKKVNHDKWHFVTGEKKDIYSIATKGYLLPTGEEGTTNTDSLKFFHSQFFVLVDNKRRIRGMYDALDARDVLRLKDEVKVLLYEVVHENDDKTTASENKK
jgi:protein SCO1/2